MRWTEWLFAAWMVLAAAAAGVAGATESGSVEPSGTEAPPARRIERKKLARACGADAARHCAGVEAGDAKLVECLTEHRAELAKNCGTVVRRLGRVAEFRARCGGDVQQYCSEVKPGGGRIRACLRENEANLSEQCREKWSHAAGQGKEAESQEAAVADDAAQEQIQNLEALPGLSSAAASVNEATGEAASVPTP